MNTWILILSKACLTYILIDIINAQINPDDFFDWEGDFFQGSEWKCFCVETQVSAGGVSPQVF